MPYSHSVVSGLLLAFVVWLIQAKAFKRSGVGLALGIGVASHLILDLITHAPDVALAPGMAEPKWGLGLYSAAPLTAFVLETLYGIFCWWIYKGGHGLLLVIVLFNLANLSMFSAAVPGPEEFLAGQPTLIVTVIAIQIAVTLYLVGIFARKTASC